MDLMEEIYTRVRNNTKTVVFPESNDDRILLALNLLIKEKLIKRVVLVGEEKTIRHSFTRLNIYPPTEYLEIINPPSSDLIKQMVDEYITLRQLKKSVTANQAKLLLQEPTFFGTMLVRTNYVDCMVAGAKTFSGKVIRTAIHLIGVKDKTQGVVGAFLMFVPYSTFGEQGYMIFADSSVIPEPTSEQLIQGTQLVVMFVKKFFAWQPRVALLSFSTKGSAVHPSLNKIIQAVQGIRHTIPDLLIDGEIQADTALIPEVAQRKAPDSPLKGKANILIFPDLNSGNIGYKLVERLANGRAYGPLLFGLNKPVSDLSRGCSVDDIVKVTVLTELQCVN